MTGKGNEPLRSDHIEGELVQDMLFGRLGVLANQVNLAVCATTVVKTHDATVGG